MKTSKWYYLKIFPILVLLSLSACSKKGSEGIQGPEGTPGTEGTPGKSGTSILSGTSDPTSSIGVEGDFFLNTQSKVIFGPKTNTSWGSGVELGGAKGDLGSTILNGSTIPSITTGRIGDYYLNMTKMDFYGPKIESGWGTPIALSPKKPLEKRILVKTNFGYSRNCNVCKQYIPAGDKSNSSRYSVTSGEEVIKTGDISNYYDNGIVIYEASINGGAWFQLDPEYSKPITNNIKIFNREYYTTFNPSLIRYNKDIQVVTIAMEREIMVPSLYSEAQLTTWLDTDLIISIRITLLPKDTVEYLAKEYNTHRIDNEFLLRYSMLQNK